MSPFFYVLQTFSYMYFTLGRENQHVHVTKSPNGFNGVKLLLSIRVSLLLFWHTNVIIVIYCIFTLPSVLAACLNNYAHASVFICDSAVLNCDMVSPDNAYMLVCVFVIYFMRANYWIKL